MPFLQVNTNDNCCQKSTPPLFETYLSEDQPPTCNPAYTHPSEYTDTAMTPAVTITANSNGSDSEDSLEAEITAHAKGRVEFEATYNEQHPYLEIEDHQPAWPTPPLTPFGSTDLKLPMLNYCGSSPGEDWKYNDLTKLHYYHCLIPSPETGKFVVAPWIKFDLLQAQPEVSMTFSKYHPKYTKILRFTPVDYDTNIISPEQARLFHLEEAFAPAIDIILSELCPPDIEAGIRHYRYYHTIAKTYQSKVADTQDHYMKNLERMMEVLDTLEKADAFSRLAVLIECAKHSTIPNPEVFQALSSVLKSLPRHNDNLSDCHPLTPRLCQVHTWQSQADRQRWANQHKADLPSSSISTETSLIAPLRASHKVPHYKPCRLGPHHSKPPQYACKHLTAVKQCYKCHGVGHVLQQCLNEAAAPWRLCTTRK